MIAWTYASAPSSGRYWKSKGVEVILVEHDNGRLEWRYVATGACASEVSGPFEHHKGTRLPLAHYPAWLHDMDDMGMDDGL